MLSWKRVSEQARDLQIVNPGDLKQDVFKGVLESFYNAPSVRPNQRLMLELIALFEKPEEAVFTCSGDMRSGYVGLNRWCITNSFRDQNGVMPARALWKFLFSKGGFNPPKLAGSPGSGALELNMLEWEDWYALISRTDS